MQAPFAGPGQDEGTPHSKQYKLRPRYTGPARNNTCASFVDRRSTAPSTAQWRVLPNSSTCAEFHSLRTDTIVRRRPLYMMIAW